MKVYSKLQKGIGTLLIAALLFAALPVSEAQAAGPWYVRKDGSDTTCDGLADAADGGTGTITTPAACAFATIGKAITAATAGDTIIVGLGTYDYVSEGEPAPEGLIKVDKPVTIKAAEGVRPIIDASGFNGAFKIWHSTYTGGEVVIEGFDIIGDSATGIAITAAMCDTADTTKIVIKDNLIHGMVGGFSAWGSGSFCTEDSGEFARSENIEIIGNEFYNLGYKPDGHDGFGVYLQDLSDWTAAGDQFAAKIENNVFKDILAVTFTGGVGIAINSPDEINNEAANARIADNSFESTVPGAIVIWAGDVTNTEIVYNGFIVTNVGVGNHDDGTANASPNWWGSIFEPVVGVQLDATVDYDPWCGDADCSFTVSADDTGTGDSYFNEGGQLVFSGEVNAEGGISITQDGLKILILSGTVIQNNSPCFTVTADNVTIEGASPGSVTCIPTADSAGIEVDADLSGLVIKNLDIDGSQTTGPAIDFAGNITDVQILNNKIHDFSADGIVFGGDVLTSHLIQGNMFMDIAGDEIFVSGTTTIDATFNSWGANAAPTLDYVLNAPFTHANLWVESSGALSDGKVARGNSVTYTVYADLTRISGAAFDLTYPTSLLTLNVTTPGDGEFVASGTDLLDTTTPGVIEFRGVASGSYVTGTGVALFTATFDAVDTLPDPNTGVMDLVEIISGFSMEPDVLGTTTHVYPAELLDGEVAVVAVYYLPLFVTD